MSYGCAECREELPARDAGALPALVQARVDAHLAGCADCRALRARWADLVAAGRAFAPAPGPDERDAIYEAVARRIPSGRLPARHPSWRAVAGAGAAALAVAATVAFVALRATSDVPHGRPPVAVAPTPTRATPPHGRVAASPAPTRAVPSAQAERSYERHAPAPGIEVHAARGAAWALRPGSPYRLELTRGTLYVSYERRRTRAGLVVTAPGVRVEVKGTVFLLRTSDAGTDVGVVRGGVLVQPDGGAAAPLAEGRVRLASGEVRALSAEETAPAPAGHDLAATPGRPTAPQPPLPTPETRSAAGRYIDAESALRRGDAGAAEMELRALVDTWPEAPEAQTARLELARLYAGVLGRSHLAVVALRAFLARTRSEDAARPARAELCRLLPRTEREVEPLCSTARTSPPPAGD